jgi:hypothetical protein
VCANTAVYLALSLADLQVTVLDYLHKEERDRETEMLKVTAKIEDSKGEREMVWTNKTRAQAEEIRLGKRNLVETGGTITITTERQR